MFYSTLLSFRRVVVQVFYSTLLSFKTSQGSGVLFYAVTFLEESWFRCFILHCYLFRPVEVQVFHTMLLSF